MIEVRAAAEAFGVTSAIIAPVYLPEGVIGAVVWAGSEANTKTPQVFAERSAELHGVAIRFIAAYHDLASGAVEPARLTRREVQCLKWAAAGKTDHEVAQIIHISMPTVRSTVAGSRPSAASAASSASRRSRRRSSGAPNHAVFHASA